MDVHHVIIFVEIFRVNLQAEIVKKEWRKGSLEGNKWKLFFLRIILKGLIEFL